MENHFKSCSTNDIKPRLESCGQSEVEKSQSQAYTDFINFLNDMGFSEGRDHGFWNKNIIIYFRKEYNEWRIKNLNHSHGMDLTGFELPINEADKKLIWKTVSDNYER